jgi:pimeloyl-ACP methyl ester carboxylesterase
VALTPGIFSLIGTLRAVAEDTRERTSPTWLEQLALLELGALVAVSPMARARKRGDKHPVLVLPGLAASDASTFPLRWHIDAWGFNAHAWGMGRNMGPTPEVIRGLRTRLNELHTRHGRKVSIVGWSMGGIYARFLARELPDAVRQVITLGSPYRMVTGDRSAASPLTDHLRPTFDERVKAARRVPEEEKRPLIVPATSVYSKIDEVVHWKHCIDRVGHHRENVEVRVPHVALGYNPGVLYVVADRLSQAEGAWKPFKPPRTLARLYPHPEEWKPSAAR